MNNIVFTVLNIPRVAKRIVAVLVDSCLCVFTVWIAIYLRMDEFYSLTGPFAIVVSVSVVLAVSIFTVSGLYGTILRYSDLASILAVGKAVLIYGLIFSAIFAAIGIPGIPRTIGIIQPILMFLAVVGTRAVAPYFLSGRDPSREIKSPSSNILIYGAGSAGQQLARALANNHHLKLVGFLDDDESLHGRRLNGFPVFAPADLMSLGLKFNAPQVLLAMPSVGRKQRNKILERIQNARLAVRTLPSVVDLAQGKVQIADIVDLDIEDLLGREAVSPIELLLTRNINEQVVLVSGAGGSIGAELCRQIAQLQPKRLLLLDHNEFGLYSIHHELITQTSKADNLRIEIVPLLGSVRDTVRIKEIFSMWSPDIVFHAAAYKHVPLVEQNSVEGIRNNVFGTLALAKVATESGVKSFVLISTDKAVRPTNVMGATKRLAEMILQSLAAEQKKSTGVPTDTGGSPIKTIFSMVRFGNVLDSSGSVVPRFREQIRSGGPITLTHLEVTRYFMTIREAAQLVIQAGAMAAGGEVFVLDMGSPIKIFDLARRMVELSGLTILDEQNPEGEIQIQITGLRPGEKLFEELLIGNSPMPTAHPRIMRALDDFPDWLELSATLDKLIQSLDSRDYVTIRELLRSTISGYSPSSLVSEWGMTSNDFEQK